MKKFIMFVLIVVICLTSCFGMCGCSLITSETTITHGEVLYRNDNKVIIKFDDGITRVYDLTKSSH